MGRKHRSFSTFSPNDSNTICDVTGFKTKISQVVRRWEGFMVIPKAFHPRQPQDFPVIPVPQQTFPVRVEIDTPESAATCSADLVWAQQTSGTANNLNGAWKEGSRWVVVGNSGTILTSDDNGVTWTPRISGTTRQLSAVTYWNNNWWVVGGSSNTAVLSSSDAVTWALSTTGFGGYDFIDIATSSTTMAFIGIESADGVVATYRTTDGVSFTEGNLPGSFPLGVDTPYGIAFNTVDNLWAAVGRSTNSKEWFGTSPDLITWTKKNISSGGSGDEIRAVDYDGTNWIVAASPTLIYTSKDSTTWKLQTEMFMSADTPASIANDGSCVIMVSGGSGTGRTIVSIDGGVTWSISFEDNSIFTIQDTHYSQGLWVAVGSSGRVMTGLSSPSSNDAFEII